MNAQTETQSSPEDFAQRNFQAVKSLLLQTAETAQQLSAEDFKTLLAKVKMLGEHPTILSQKIQWKEHDYNIVEFLLTQGYPGVGYTVAITNPTLINQKVIEFFKKRRENTYVVMLEILMN